MHCADCDFENPEGMNFCGKCGSPLVPRCPQCGFENPSGFAFCGKCGTALSSKAKAKKPRTKKPSGSQRPASSVRKRVESSVRESESTPAHYTPSHLAERIRAEQAAMEARGANDGERKTITVLFADIKGSMELIEGLDPEEARSIIDPTLALMMDAVHRYEGYVAQSTGDGIFAFFGAPIAHEDHAHRAIYAALRMQEEARRHAERMQREKGVKIQLRVGLNSGEVVVRSIRKDDLHTDYVPVGHSTSLAARMESLATPGAVVVSEYTHRLTEGYFEFKSFGATKVKGVSKPIDVYEVLGVSPVQTRLQVAVRRGLVRFVGRRQEVEQIEKAWEQAQAGRGQIVAVMGEAGVGKSRLFHEFKLLVQKGGLVLEAFSVSHGRAYAYLPLIELLKSYFQLTPQDDEHQRREKIASRVLALDHGLGDTLPYLFFLLGTAESSSPLRQMDPQIRQKRTLDAIKRLFLRESLNQPVLLIFEDLHWVDSETQSFLLLLGESLPSARMLLLVNYRPEYQHPWGNKSYYTQLRLDALTQKESEELLSSLLQEKARMLDAAPLRQFILAKTEGNPFFIEEIVQELVEEEVEARHVASLPETLHLPATVQAILASRIDRLPAAEKSLLQTLAVIGKEFSLTLIQQVVDQPESHVLALLSHLQAAEFIYEQAAFPDVKYVFKHAFTQEVAYNSLLLEHRRVLHECTAQAIETLFHSRLEDHYNELAQHYTHSGNTGKAIEYLRLAGRQALQRSANEEAITHLTGALEFLKTLPDSPERIQQELMLQIALGVPLQALKGPAAPEAEAVYARARELCQQLEDAPQLIPVLGGLWSFYLLRGELDLARDLAERILALARDVEAPALLLQAHRMVSTTVLWRGELDAVQEHLQEVLALYDPQQHRSHAFLYYGLDPGAVCLAIEACALWFLGYPDQSVTKAAAALKLAQELAHPPSLAFVLSYIALLDRLRGEPQAVQERARAMISLAQEQGLPFWATQGPIHLGWALAVQGQYDAGVVSIRQGLAEQREMGVRLAEPLNLGVLAEACQKAGQNEKGLAVVTEALETLNVTGERVCEAELYRLKGELLRSMGEQESGRAGEQIPHSSTPPFPHSSPEECFLKAIDIARQQQAKSLELRAVMSLSRLRQQQGRKEEARQQLAEIYGWFTEGFTTADLRGAKGLMEELG
jgi:class 3 adenylate cyclase/predicted ATPase